MSNITRHSFFITHESEKDVKYVSAMLPVML